VVSGAELARELIYRQAISPSPCANALAPNAAVGGVHRINRHLRIRRELAAFRNESFDRTRIARKLFVKFASAGSR
jgi:hypothetical protein